MLSADDARMLVQKRIDAALAGIYYSPSLETYAVDLQDRFRSANNRGGIEGICRALDEFDSMFVIEDPIRVRYAFLTFLVNCPQVKDMGLKLPQESKCPAPSA